MSHRAHILLSSFATCVFTLGFGFGCQSGTNPNEPPIEISADDLHAAYEKDLQKANDRYRGKTVRVTGIVEGLDLAVMLGKHLGVACWIKPESADKLGILWLHDTVTVEGVCKGQNPRDKGFVYIDVTDAVIIDIKKKE